MLARAADQFVVSTATGPSVVAGYPWFGEWSRDTMTSYEGLFLCTRRYEEGHDLLARSAATLSEGMLANTADAGGLEYNTADGTLWFIHAVGRHVAVTGDVDILTKLNGAARRDHRRALPRHPIRHQGRSERRLVAAGRPRVGVDMDGRPRRRAADHATRRARQSRSTRSGSTRSATITDLHSRLGRHTGRWQSLHDFARGIVREALRAR